VCRTAARATLVEMLPHATRRVVLGVLIGLFAGASGLTMPACLGHAPRSLCVKHERSCGGPTVCESADECVPAEAYGAEAATDCDEGRCVWDCSDGETCPDGWACEAQELELADLVDGC
jgi:hypothetical protein